MATTRPDATEIARVAANIETVFNDQLGYEKSANGKTVNEYLRTPDGKKYKILADYDFPHPEGDYQKAVALQNKKTGEIYFHFNGTGDGNWGYNAAAYGAEPQPSEMQTRCADWFDEAYNDLVSKGQITDSSKIYVTGHSQGGNNAMYVMMRAQNADKIDVCVPLDGPSFSNKFVSDTRAMLGAEYSDRINKIWAFNGENDFVSILGQQSIVPDGHTKYIQYAHDEVDFMYFHLSDGLIDKYGNIKVLDDGGPLRKRLESAVKKILTLPQEDQALAAEVIMKFCENNLGKDDKEPRKVPLSSEEFDKIKPALIPVILELFAYNPDEFADTLKYLFGMSAEAAQAIVDLIKKFDSYSEDIRELMIIGVLDVITYKDGKFDINKSKIPEAIVLALPTTVETLITNLGDVWKILEEPAVKEAIKKWVTEHPWETAGLIVLTAVVAPIAIPSGLVIDIGIRIIQGIVDIAPQVKEAIIDFIEGAKKSVNKFKEWLDKTVGGGGKPEEPHFKADTAKLLNYAYRLDNVQRRMTTLDSNMRSLYGQVKLTDLWTILKANVLTSRSGRLYLSSKYLKDTADTLAEADIKARQYLGG